MRGKLSVLLVAAAAVLLLSNCRGGVPAASPTVTLTVSVVGAGRVKPASGAYRQGSSITLTAYPDAFWRFDHLEGGVTGTKTPISFKIRSNTTVTAVFVAIGSPTSTSTRTPTRTATSTSTPSQTPTPIAAIPITIVIDTSQDRAAISPYIYGANSDMGLNLLTFRRLGGNRMTGYNWENNASNAGVDWNQQSDEYMCVVLGLTSAQCSTVGGVITAWHDQSVAMGVAEAEAIVLMQRPGSQVARLLLEEKAAREVAMSLRLPLSGFVGVLLSACQDEILTAEEARSLLRNCRRQGTHYSEALIADTYRRCIEMRRR